MTKSESENFDAWIGREMAQNDLLGKSLARRWCATLGREFPADEIMPQGVHFCLCTPEAAQDNLGEDGHPKRDAPDSFMPPIPLPRRMWASSAITFHKPLKIGDFITRKSRIASIKEKTGASGALAFVDVSHETYAGTDLAIEEVQTLVYREAVAADVPLSPPKVGAGAFDTAAWDHVTTLVPDERLLFRYSALTFNTHRIHYDAPYAQGVERYRGLVVHGPLIASLLLRHAAGVYGDNALASFTFRASSPAIAGEALHLAIRRDGDSLELGSFAADGRQTLSASAALT